MAEEVKAPESGKWWVTKPDAIAPIRMGQQGDDAEPLTLVTNLLRETVQRHGDRPAMVAADGRQFTWRQYYDECIKFAKSLIHMGFERHNAVRAGSWRGARGERMDMERSPESAPPPPPLPRAAGQHHRLQLARVGVR